MMKKSRRSFIKQSAAAASATTFAGLISTPGVAGADTGGGTTQPNSTQAAFSITYYSKKRSGSATVVGTENAAKQAALAAAQAKQYENTAGFPMGPFPSQGPAGFNPNPPALGINVTYTTVKVSDNPETWTAFAVEGWQWSETVANGVPE